jgi:hypothetical protein
MNVSARLTELRRLDYRQPGARWQLWLFLRTWFDPRMTTSKTEGLWEIRRGNGQAFSLSDQLPETFSAALMRASEEWLALSAEEQAYRREVAGFVRAHRAASVTYAQTDRGEDILFAGGAQ